MAEPDPLPLDPAWNLLVTITITITTDYYYYYYYYYLLLLFSIYYYYLLLLLHFRGIPNGPRNSAPPNQEYG